MALGSAVGLIAVLGLLWKQAQWQAETDAHYNLLQYQIGELDKRVVAALGELAARQAKTEGRLDSDRVVATAAQEKIYEALKALSERPEPTERRR